MVSSPVAQALRDGPFEVALAAAIDRSGLTLDRVRERLAGRGVEISRTTLSYWRQGRSRPERAVSLEAVGCLEELLGLPPASLLKLLGPHRTRGRWAGRPPGMLSRSRLWPPAGPILSRLGAPADGDLLPRSVHDLLRLGPDRSERTLRTRMTVEATAAVHQMPVYYQLDRPNRQPPRLGRVWCGPPGRTVLERHSGVLVSELLFDRPLSPGERTVVEYELAFPPGPPLETFHRRFSRTAAEYVLVVGFGEAVPARCHRFRQRSPGSPERAGDEVWIGGTGVAQSVTVDVTPGILGLRWCWS